MTGPGMANQCINDVPGYACQCDEPGYEANTDSSRCGRKCRHDIPLKTFFYTLAISYSLFINYHDIYQASYVYAALTMAVCDSTTSALAWSTKILLRGIFGIH